MMKANAEGVLLAGAAFEQPIVKARASPEAVPVRREGEAGDKDQVYAREIGSRALVEFRRCKVPGGLRQQREIIHADQFNPPSVRARKAKCRRTFTRPKWPNIRLTFHRHKSADEPRFLPLTRLLNSPADGRGSSAPLRVRESKRASASKPFAQFIFRRGTALFHIAINTRMQPRCKVDGSIKSARLRGARSRRPHSLAAVRARSRSR